MAQEETHYIFKKRKAQFPVLEFVAASKGSAVNFVAKRLKMNLTISDAQEIIEKEYAIGKTYYITKVMRWVSDDCIENHFTRSESNKLFLSDFNGKFGNA